MPKFLRHTLVHRYELALLAWAGALPSVGRTNSWCPHGVRDFEDDFQSWIQPRSLSRGIMVRGGQPQRPTLRRTCLARTAIPEPALGRFPDPQSRIPLEIGNRLFPNSGP